MTEWEHMAGCVLRWGVKSEDTRSLQSALEYLGYSLPKYGIDGYLGTELENAVDEFCDDHGQDPREIWSLDDGAPNAMDLSGDFAAGVCQMAEDVEGVMQRYSVADERGSSVAANVRGSRAYPDIDTVVLHQCGVWMSDTPKRFRRLRAHMGVLRDGHCLFNAATETETRGPTIVLVHDLNAYLWHANGLNKQSVGIEVNGHYLGTTRHVGRPGRESGPPGHQLESTRESVRFVCDMVKAHGGQIRNILPHRVASMTRRSDPGEVIWGAVGLWAQTELGLSDGGPGFEAGGRPIPEEWDPRYAGEEY